MGWFASRVAKKDRWRMRWRTVALSARRRRSTQLCEIFGRRQCLRRAATPLLPRGRGAQSGCDRNRAEIIFAATGYELRFLRAAAAARTARCVYVHSPPSQSCEMPADLLARNAERHLKTPKEMTQLFADLPEAIANTESLSVASGIFAATISATNFRRIRCRMAARRWNFFARARMTAGFAVMARTIKKQKRRSIASLR